MADKTFYCPLCNKKHKVIGYDADEILTGNSDDVDESFLIYCDVNKKPIRIVIGNGVNNWHNEINGVEKDE
jgi:hypothetical protein